jgi:anti-sigma regulatory factor (Ser/Thr protein kinase)
VHLVLDQAIPCGLILNELISNALKHAFPVDRPGIIRIDLELREEQVRITVADDGVGVPRTSPREPMVTWVSNWSIRWWINWMVSLDRTQWRSWSDLFAYF